MADYGNFNQDITGHAQEMDSQDNNFEGNDLNKKLLTLNLMIQKFLDSEFHH